MGSRRLAVIGGGIAGLAGARAALDAAREAGLDLAVTVYEAGEAPGGKVRTERIDGVDVEWGPDSFLAAKPRGRELAGELGLAGELVGTGPAARRAYLLVGGRLRPLPSGLWMGVPGGLGALAGAVRSGILGPVGAARVALEPFLPRDRRPDRSVAEVARRRLGRQAADRLVAPLILGVWGTPASTVSFEAALPQLAGGRSLVLAALRRPPATGPPFLAVRGGLGRLIAGLVAGLGSRRIRTGTTVERLRPGARTGFRLSLGGREARADAVLVAVPAPVAARLLAETSPGAALALGWIGYRSSAVVLVRYPRGALVREMDGSGFLAAPEDGTAVAACTWLGQKWPHLGVPGDWLRAFVTSPEALALDDDELGARVERELGRVMRAREPAHDVRLVRWTDALPVYGPGHLRRVAAAERALPPGLALAGASYRGIGLPDCIESGERAARGLVGWLSGGPAG
ncbi:MAG: protoporphyrinogen oxidase [Actinobacteria bacterium]|nr:protoporphyrinogen oxidase [Actinomycetota bacterium]